MKRRNRATGSCLVQVVKRCGLARVETSSGSCVKDPNAVKLEKHRGVYWLPCSATEHTDGTPLCPNPIAARLAVEAPPISLPDPDATQMQLGRE